MKRHYAKGLCRYCYKRPYQRAHYLRVRADPVRYRKLLDRVAACEQRRLEAQALADLARVTQALEDML